MISMIKGHKWIGTGLFFEVLWEDNDITYERWSNVDECEPLDPYLKLQGVENAADLPKAKCSLEIMP